jgi:hypothetical protein
MNSHTNIWHSDSSKENKNASVKNLSSNNWKKFQRNFLLHTNKGASIRIRIYGTCKLQCIQSTNITRVIYMIFKSFSSEKNVFNSMQFFHLELLLGLLDNRKVYVASIPNANFDITK